MAFHFQSFAGLPLRHAMSQRILDAPSQGDVGYARDTNPDHSAENRARFLAQAGIEAERLALGRQVHGAAVATVTAADSGRGQPPDFDAIPATDGLLTACRAVAPAVVIADCVPVLLYDPVQHALGVIHAGWRGTVADITGQAVAQMAAAFGSRPRDLLAGIGPSIGPCCYEVGPEVIAGWAASGVAGWRDARVERSPRPHFDLWRANRLNLLRAGVLDSRIETAAICTKCVADHFFSHRAAVAGERPAGRMIMAAQLT